MFQCVEQSRSFPSKLNAPALNYCPSHLWQHSLPREMMVVPQHVCAAKLLFNPPLKPSNTFLKQFESQTTGRAWLVGKRPTLQDGMTRGKKHMGSNEVEEHDSCRENIQRLYWPYCVGCSFTGIKLKSFVLLMICLSRLDIFHIK